MKHPLSPSSGTCQHAELNGMIGNRELALAAPEQLACSCWSGGWLVKYPPHGLGKQFGILEWWCPKLLSPTRELFQRVGWLRRLHGSTPSGRRRAGAKSTVSRRTGRNGNSQDPHHSALVPEDGTQHWVGEPGLGQTGRPQAGRMSPLGGSQWSKWPPSPGGGR